MTGQVPVENFPATVKASFLMLIAIAPVHTTGCRRLILGNQNKQLYLQTKLRRQRKLSDAILFGFFPSFNNRQQPRLTLTLVDVRSASVLFLITSVLFLITEGLEGTAPGRQRFIERFLSLLQFQLPQSPQWSSTLAISYGNNWLCSSQQPIKNPRNISIPRVFVNLFVTFSRLVQPSR